MKDLVSLIIVMEQSLKLFVVNMENSKWMYLRIAIVPLSLRGFQNARRTSKTPEGHQSFVGTLRPYQKKIHNGWDSQQMETVPFHHAFCRLLLKLSQFHAIIIINERSVYAKERSDMKTTEQQHNERKRELMEKVEDEYYLKSQMEVLKQGVALFVDKYKANQA